jgi:hypothetical protein
VALSRTLPSEAAAWSLGIALSVTASATAAVVANYFEIFPADLMFWVLVGILASLQNEQRRAGHRGAGDGGGRALRIVRAASQLTVVRRAGEGA